jgi:hypothetical protein
VCGVTGCYIYDRSWLAADMTAPWLAGRVHDDGIMYMMYIQTPAAGASSA